MTLAQSANTRDEQLSAVAQEEAENYYRKWLTEDVVYIITQEERDVFANLTTPEEKERFIEQFWLRRDTDPSTSFNEFKEEHYRRIAYANEQFTSGHPGWRTDRGRIYIIHGPPADIESHAGAGRYNRPIDEGGEIVTTFPFEIWSYRHIEGIGSNIQLEFVDPSMSGEFYLSHDPKEKDALAHIPTGAGHVDLDELAMITGSRDAMKGLVDPGLSTYRTDPFWRYETYTRALSPAPLQFRDLEQLIGVEVSYDSLSFMTHEDYFQLNEDQVLIPVTVRFQNKDLQFGEEPSGLKVARLAIYGKVTDLSNRIVSEFDDEVVASIDPSRMVAELSKPSVYQKILVLDPKMRYKLDLVVKDLKSSHVGTLRRALLPPKFGEDQLSTSSLVLSNDLEVLESAAEEEERFVLGDVKIRPVIDNTFTSDLPLAVYLQVYNASLDQSTLAPALTISYTVSSDTTWVKKETDRTNQSVHFVSNQRIVLMKELGIRELKPGNYHLEVAVVDEISQDSVKVQEPFTVTAVQR